MSAGSSSAPCATAANDPIPRSIRPSRPSTDTVTPSSEASSFGGRRDVARSHLVGRGVLQVARPVDRLRDDRRLGDDVGQVVVRGEDQRVDVGALLRRLESQVAVSAEQRPLDDRRGDLRADLVRHLPAQPPRAQLACAAQRRGGRDPHALAVEIGARAKPDEHPALAAGVPDREVAVLGFRLARVDEPLKDAVHVVRDALAFEDPEHHRVRIGVRRKRGG